MATVIEMRKQVAGLQQQIEKLIADINALRVKDHALFDRQEKQIGELKALARDYQLILASLPDVSVWGCDYATFANWQQQKEKLEARAKTLLGDEKES